MPKAAIHKQGDSGFRENKVGSAWKEIPTAPSYDSEFSKQLGYS